MDWFSFNGIRSDDMGLRLIERPEIVRAGERVQTQPIPGRDGALTILEADDPVFEPIDVSLVTVMLPGADVRAINAWLIGAGALIISTEPDKAYRARIIRTFSFDRIARGMPHRRVGLTFACDPFIYDAANAVRTYTTNGSIFNPGTQYANPIIDVYGSGDVGLIAGSSTLLITGVSGSIRIDSEARLATMGGLLATHRLTGDWPRLDPGSTSILWTGSVTKLEITPNWRWL